MMTTPTCPPTPPHRRRSAPLLLAAIAGIAAGFSLSGIARAQPASTVAPGAAIDPPPPVPTTPAAVGTTNPSSTAEDDGDALDPAFSSVLAGIAVRPPTGGVMRQSAGGDEIVRFADDKAKWTFVVTRVLLEEPVPILTRDPAKAATDPKLVGFANSLAEQMPSDTAGAIIRSEAMPINGNDGAMLASRFTEADGSKRFIQQAVIHRTDKVYYVLTYTVPVGTGPIEQDPAAKRALATFSKIVDSSQLLDQEAITRDQEDRLVRTRAMMVNWSPERLKRALVPEQWLRLIKDGKDIGYTYIVQEVASDVPRKGTHGTAADTTVRPNANGTDTIPGVRVGIRSRTIPDAGFRVDAETWDWVRYDRKQESFRNLIKSVEGTNDPKYAMEVGTSVNRDRLVPSQVAAPGAVNGGIVLNKDDRIELQIWSTSNLQQLPPLNREVPPFYLPQALTHLLPRLLPLDDPKTYLFATYVSESRGIVMRYVDVLTPRMFKLPGSDGPAQMVVPIDDRAGFEGSITTHYLTPDGRYLGSVNKDAKIAILATDAPTLQKIWADAILQRPEDVDEQSQQSQQPTTPDPSNGTIIRPSNGGTRRPASPVTPAPVRPRTR